VLRVVRVGEPRPASVESDDYICLAYICLAVDWVPPASVRPVYYRVHGELSGDVEVKLEPNTGEVIGLVVIEPPSNRIRVPRSALERGSGSGAVFIDLEEWDLDADHFPRRQVVHDKQTLALGEAEGSIYYSWFDEEPDRFIWSGSVGLGITVSNKLSGIVLSPTSGD
jgi:hypothetical protein